MVFFAILRICLCNVLFCILQFITQLNGLFVLKFLWPCSAGMEFLVQVLVIFVLNLASPACSILICHHPLRHVIELHKQHNATSLVLKFGVLSLTYHLPGYRARNYLLWSWNIMFIIFSYSAYHVELYSNVKVLQWLKLFCTRLTGFIFTEDHALWLLYPEAEDSRFLHVDACCVQTTWWYVQEDCVSSCSLLKFCIPKFFFYYCIFTIIAFKIC
jgi:hypothetical protein